ncbi:RNA-directed DNA polymerase from mobile element jockey-like [Brachionus plicatilis]|uniref:RNA-directed DNA polymerase from mobile element jockey-like n=1 Tax=Brachionus plicatilis TaxID=10195 RepID=A0A3M7T0R9_BRAPC|nr:RNA-directed DNA polymerase from mobile element jockey-like [Brachionus plicatilis]
MSDMASFAKLSPKIEHNPKTKNYKKLHSIHTITNFSTPTSSTEPLKALTCYYTNATNSYEVIDNDLNCELVESVWCRVDSGLDKILVGCFYRPPHSSREISIQINKSLAYAKQQYLAILTIQKSYGVILAVHASQDLVITNDSNRIYNVNTGPPLGSSVKNILHNSLTWEFSVHNTTKECNPSMQLKFIYKKCDFSKFSEELDNYDWENEFSNLSVDEMYNKFTFIYDKLVKKSVPQVISTTEHTEAKKTFNKFCKILKKAIKRAKGDFEFNLAKNKTESNLYSTPINKSKTINKRNCQYSKRPILQRIQDQRHKQSV